MSEKHVPYFIAVGGCSNCKVNQEYITITGTFYEEGHALHAKCSHMGCDKYGHSIENPFITPQEYLRIAKESGLQAALDKAKKIIVKFFDFYDPKGNLLPWVLESISRKKDEKPVHTKAAPPIPGLGVNRRI